MTAVFRTGSGERRSSVGGGHADQETQVIKTLLVSAAALALAVPGAALAQDYGWYQHQQDHAEHYQTHDEIDAAHAGAHERGFYSREEHQGYHRSLRDAHDEFHDDHPGTRHDGYRLPRTHRGHRAYGYSSYGSAQYGYAPYDTGGYGYRH
jgi:hypothetical protein